MPLTWAGTVERATRIELALSAWEADVLPLNYARAGPQAKLRHPTKSGSLMWTAPGCTASTRQEMPRWQPLRPRVPTPSPLVSQPGTSPEPAQGDVDCCPESAQVLTNRPWEASHLRGSRNE